MRTNKGDASKTDVNEAYSLVAVISNMPHTSIAMTRMIAQERWRCACGRRQKAVNTAIRNWQKDNRRQQNSKHYKVVFHSVHLLI